MAAWSYDGPDTESATALERDHLSAQLNAILARLGTGYMLHVDAIRTPAVSYPSPDRSFFPDPITRLIDDERRQHFQSAAFFFESRHVLVLHLQPARPARLEGREHDVHGNGRPARNLCRYGAAHLPAHL